MLNHLKSSPEKPNRVVILGGSGFVGQSLIKRLDAQDIGVVAFSSADINLVDESAVKHLQEVLKPEDTLLVLSALTPDRGKGVDTFMANLKMVENISAALQTSPVAHVIYCSSDAVYPLSIENVDENTPAAPTDLYGVMHLSREIIMQSTVSAPLCVIRPTLIYGADDSHNSYGPNRFRRLAATEQRIGLGGEGEETRDHIYIDDIVDLISLIISHQSEGVLNLATGTSLSFMDVAKRVSSLFDNEIEIATSERHAPITYRQFDVSAIKQAFPDFSFTSFEDGSKLAHEQSA